MKFICFYDEYGYVDVETAKDYEVIAWLLTDNNYIEGIDNLVCEIEKISEEGGNWEMSYNKSFLEINSEGVICGDLYNEERTNRLTHKRIVKLLKEWRAYLVSNQKMKKVIYI